MHNIFWKLEWELFVHLNVKFKLSTLNLTHSRLLNLKVFSFHETCTVAFFILVGFIYLFISWLFFAFDACTIWNGYSLFSRLSSTVWLDIVRTYSLNIF